MHFLTKAAMVSALMAASGAAGAADAATTLGAPAAEWTYYAGVVDASGKPIVSVPETIKIISSTTPATTVSTSPSFVGSGSVGVVFTPSAGVSAVGTTSYTDTTAFAYSELFYEWRATSATAFDFSALSPNISITGFADLSHNALTGYASAIINAAPAFATSKGQEVGENSSDTDAATYRETYFQCGDIGGAQSCGVSDFVLRGMYSMIDDYTIGGFISLRASAIANTLDDEINYTFIGPKTSSAFIDPVISFDKAFLAAHPDLQITTSAGIGNGATAPVPEVATWAMMIIGFGLVGSIRRRSKPAFAA